jgi:hypothetical protein
MRRRAFVMALIAAVSFSSARADAQGPGRQTRQETSMKDHPFLGDWTANIAKSKPSRDYAFKSATLRVDLTG